MSGPDILFYVFAVCLIVASLGVIVARSPINAAMSLVAAFFFLAGIYVLLWAHTIAVLQVLVYAGAVMVLFLFVIMLLSLGERAPRSPITVSRVVGGAAALGLGVLICLVLLRLDGSVPVMTADAAMKFGTISRMGELIYGTYLLAFEAVSLLLLAAMVGAVVVAKSRI